MSGAICSFICIGNVMFLRSWNSINPFFVFCVFFLTFQKKKYSSPKWQQKIQFINMQSLISSQNQYTNPTSMKMTITYTNCILCPKHKNKIHNYFPQNFNKTQSTQFINKIEFNYKMMNGYRGVSQKRKYLWMYWIVVQRFRMVITLLWRVLIQLH